MVVFFGVLAYKKRQHDRSAKKEPDGSEQIRVEIKIAFSFITLVPWGAGPRGVAKCLHAKVGSVSSPGFRFLSPEGVRVTVIC